MLGSKTVLSHVIENLQKCKNIDQIILAIPDNPENMDLIEYENIYKIKMFAGDENNVLDRFIQAAEFYDVKNILRVCADAPFLPPWLVDYAIEMWNPKKIGYMRSTGMPLGQNIELMTLSALKSIEVPSPEEKEHVTLALYKSSTTTRSILDIDSLTVDTPADLKELEKIGKYYE